MSPEAARQLAIWPGPARQLFSELIDDAGSDLQRELLMRAVAAFHTPSEVHAFADQLRGLGDAETYAACTLDGQAPDGYTVAQLLKAEADPLYAYELLGGTIEPNELDQAMPPPPRIPSGVELLPAVDPLIMGLSKRQKPASFLDDGHAALPPSVAPGSPRRLDTSSGEGGGSPLERFLDEATREFRIRWQLRDLDRTPGLSLSQGIGVAADALQRGLPVAASIGPNPGEHRRFVVLLQVSTSGRSRAWQLYDPFTAELVWTNEADLLAGAELPFANKANRRLTRLVLPITL